MIATANLLDKIPSTLPAELIETLCLAEHVRIERIISRGHASPPDFWYDQENPEFVLLVSGRARLDFDDAASVTMAPGDWLIIPAHKKHRVEWTDPAQHTVWLAVHFAATAPEDTP